MLLLFENENQTIKIAVVFCKFIVPFVFFGISITILSVKGFVNGYTIGNILNENFTHF